MYNFQGAQIFYNCKMKKSCKMGFFIFVFALNCYQIFVLNFTSHLQVVRYILLFAKFSLTISVLLRVRSLSFDFSLRKIRNPVTIGFEPVMKFFPHFIILHIVSLLLRLISSISFKTESFRHSLNLHLKPFKINYINSLVL